MANAPSEAPLNKDIEGGVEDFWCDLMFPPPPEWQHRRYAICQIKCV